MRTNFYQQIFVLLLAHLFVYKSLFILLHKCLLKKFVRLYVCIFVKKFCSLFHTLVCYKNLFDYMNFCSYVKQCSYKRQFVRFQKGCSINRTSVRLCTHFLPTFQKLFQNSSVRVPLRLQKFFKSKFFKSFSKSRVYVYRGEHMFEKSNKISKGLFYYISNAYIL